MSAVSTDRLGRVFTGTSPQRIDRSQILAFADAVGALAPQHRDVAAAQAAGHADLVAPLTFAVVVAQRAEAEYVQDPASGIDFTRVVHGEERFTHHRPIVAGDVLAAAVHVDSIIERASITMVTTRTVITASGGAGLDGPVAVVTSTLAVRGEGR